MFASARFLVSAQLALWFLLMTTVCGSVDAAAEATPPPEAPTEVTASSDPAPKTLGAHEHSLRIQLNHPEMNAAPEEADAIQILVRDRKTNTVSQMTLLETSPASEIFAGNFTINWTDNLDALDLEILVPDQALVHGESSHKKLKEALDNHELKPKPTFFSVEDNQHVLNVYEKQEDANRAQTEYATKQKQNNSPTEKPALTPVHTTEKKDELASSVFESQQMANIISEENAALEIASRRRNERTGKMTKAQETLRKLKEKFDALSEADKVKQRALSERYAAAALKLYQKNQFVKAEKYFGLAFTLNPYNPAPLYDFGITLFRNKKYNDSLVYLDLAVVPAEQKGELQFYQALDHYYLKEYEAALEKFDDLRVQKVKPLGPSAAFYEGLIQFQRSRYQSAKPYFEEVLDTSTEPTLDRQAENYIEQIAKLEQFAENRKKKFIFDAYLGMQYDSNILLLSSSQLQSQPSNVGGVRSPGGMSFYWRPVYDPRWEAGIRAKIDTIYTFNSSLAYADPLVYDISVPFIYKTTLGGKAFRTELRPAYEVLFYDPNQTGTKIDYINSVLLTWNNTLVMNEWFTSANLKLRKDSGVTDPNTSANQIALNWNNLFYQDAKKSKAIITDITLTDNVAVGTQYAYQRGDLGLLYMAPVPVASFTATGGLTYYWSQYNNYAPNIRTDNDYAAVLYLTRPLSSWLNLSLNGSYIINNSTDPLSGYNKYLVGATFSSEFQF